MFLSKLLVKILGCPIGYLAYLFTLGCRLEKKENYVDAHTHARKIGRANNFKIFGGNINPKGINRTDYWEDDTLRLIIYH